MFLTRANLVMLVCVVFCSDLVGSTSASDQPCSYVQARGGSFLLVPRRLNFFETQINVIRNYVKRKIWQKESYKSVAVAVRLRSTPIL